MADFAPRASLDTLPTELVLGHILCHFSSGGVRTRDGISPDERAAAARSLSQTCRRLRAVTLHLCWERVTIKTVRKLGQLHVLLQASPSLGSYVKNFSFVWDMDGDARRCGLLVEEPGSLLDLAFCDRAELWESRRQRYGCDVEWEPPMEEPRVPMAYFKHDRRSYFAPGQPTGLQPKVKEDEEDEDEDDEGDDEWISQLSKTHAPRDRAIGPDGEGEDENIKNGLQLIECVTDVVSRLTSLEDFRWNSPAMPMPRGVLDTLVQLATLTALDVTYGDGNRNMSVHHVPLWEVSRRLKVLAISFVHYHPYEEKDIEEQAEDALEWAPAPTSLPDEPVRFRFHLGIEARTVIAAARGGHLRSLRCDRKLQQPFAIRSLLPYWVRMEKWGWNYIFTERWQGAAVSLRPFLAHASLWLGATETSDPREERLLSRQDVQALQSYFTDDNLPKLCQSNAPRKTIQPVKRYLPWLAEDAELAQQVADTWNALIERGQADLWGVCCPCKKCYDYRKELKRLAQASASVA